MEKNSEKFMQLVYELMTGAVDTEKCEVWKNAAVQNEFETGSFCDGLYQKVYEANQRLCERLGENEDADVETILSSLMQITEHLSKKMYGYGALFGGLPENEKDSRKNPESL